MVREEKEILALIGTSTCSIIDLEKNLLEKGINNFKTKGHLNHFLKKRPELFGMTDTHVWSKVLRSLENEILLLIGTSPCSIIDLRKNLLEKGINHFKAKGDLSIFLKKSQN